MNVIDTSTTHAQTHSITSTNQHIRCNIGNELNLTGTTTSVIIEHINVITHITHTRPHQTTHRQVVFNMAILHSQLPQSTFAHISVS